MKKYSISLILCILSFLLMMQPAHAIAVADTANQFPPVLITEMQPGTSASASQEFIELYNQSASVIDLTAQGWQLQIASSTATDWSRTKNINLTGLFYPGKYYLLASNYTVPGETESYLHDYASAQFSSGLTASAGHIRLVNAASLASEKPAQDMLEWSTGSNDQQALAALPEGGVRLSSTLEPGSSIKRGIGRNGVFLYGQNTQYITSSCPSPTANNVNTSDGTQSTAAPLPTNIDTANPSCALAQTQDDSNALAEPTSQPPSILLPDDQPTVAPVSRIPQGDIGLEAPQISELLPNPAAPKTDVHDEFIELYNGNQRNFDLSGFMLATSGSTARTYTFPEGSTLAAGKFAAWHSDETKLSLPNSGGQVTLYDPLGNVIGKTIPYGAAKDGLAWAFAQGTWQWTDTSTPGEANVIHQKISTKLAKAQAKATEKPKATAKTKSVSSAKKQSKAQPPLNAQNTAAILKTPVNTRIIALIGACALLYGAYEYRRDLANRFHEFRSNRKTRRANRQSD